MAFSYARYTKYLQEITGFGMKTFISLPGLGWKSSLAYEKKIMSLYILIKTNSCDGL